ncbi:MAG: DUF4214 domain-containing protein [Desulfobacterales bacterium]|nr:MAG: DUF4214 domain-containing protein [Desulfobacterales bacterium]
MLTYDLNGFKCGNQTYAVTLEAQDIQAKTQDTQAAILPTAPRGYQLVSRQLTTVTSAETMNLIARYYQDILDRDPEPEGAAAWSEEMERIICLNVDIKEGFIALAKLFFNSREYELQDKTNAQYVTDLYQTFFNRAPDPAGSEYWIGRLDQGLSRNVLLNFFVYSDEFRLFMADILGSDPGRPECNLVNDLYRGLQGRLPDTAGFAGWVDLMRTAMSTSEQAVRELARQIAQGFLQSAGYTLRGRTDVEFLEDLYNGILRRGAEKSEFDGWLELIQRGMGRAEVLQDFTDSVEFQLRVQSIIEAAGDPPSN